MLLKTIIVIALFLPFGIACSCLAITNQEGFNSADIVAHVKILSKSNDPNSNIRYGIFYNETFKPHIPNNNPHVIVPIPMPKEIITGANSAACGIDFMEIGEEYLISGLRDNHLLAINLCLPLNGIMWSTVDQKLLSDLRTGFQNMNGTQH